MSADEARAVMRLGIGRIFRLAARPPQPGDIAVYDHARGRVLDAAEVLGIDGSAALQHRPNYVRDRRGGAQGD